MNLRIHVAIFVVFFAAHTVNSSISSASAAAKQQVSGIEPKTFDDLYIDDEGDDDIQLADEASGLGPLKSPALGVEDEDEEGEEEEEEEDEEEDEEPVPIEPAKKAKDAGTTAASNKTNSNTAGISNIDYKDEVMVPPKVSPVAASPSSGKPPSSPSVSIDDDEDDEDNFDGASGSGAGSNPDDENEDEDDYDSPTDEDDDMGGIDVTSVITEPVPRAPAKPEKKPEVVVVAPVPTAPTKPPKEPSPVPSSSPPPMIPGGGRDDSHVPAETATTPSSPIDPAAPDNNNRGGHNDVQIDHKSDERQASFFAQPGILAAVIGGAVVGLLCAILLVMFIVYRMRKKDEGSYVLDEPKRNSPNSHPYNKNSREFYA